MSWHTLCANQASGRRRRPLHSSDIEENVMYLKFMAAALVLAFLAGCNTMAGAGKDIQKGGESLENSAEKHKN
jgi:predicted small secreted protein